MQVHSYRQKERTESRLQNSYNVSSKATEKGPSPLSPFSLLADIESRDYDVKLIKLGHRELCSRQGSETGTHGSKHSAAHEGDDTVESPELVK